MLELASFLGDQVMLSLLTLKFIAAGIIFILSIVTGLGPIRVWLANPHHEHIANIEAFAGGIFLGAALFHMLPDATREFTKVYGATTFPYTNLICAFGFILLLFLEKVILYYAKHRYVNNLHVIPYILAIVLSVHALSEGTALGVNISLANSFIIFLAIIVHKSSESFALAASLTRSKMSLPHIATMFLFFSAVTPLGIIIGALTSNYIPSNDEDLLEAIFNAFAAGTFLYIATLHNLHHKHVHEEMNYFYEFIALVFGLSIMAVAAIWV